MRKLRIILGILLITCNLFAQLKITSASVNLRSAPEIKDNKICVIPKGTSVSILKDTCITDDCWSKVNYQGKIGYVANDFLIDLNSNSDNYNYTTPSGSGVKYYTNSQGKKVQSPTYYKSPPKGATAECRDGTYSFSQNRRGTCSHHGGVKRWLP